MKKGLMTVGVMSFAVVPLCCPTTGQKVHSENIIIQREEKQEELNKRQETEETIAISQINTETVALLFDDNLEKIIVKNPKNSNVEIKENGETKDKNDKLDIEKVDLYKEMCEKINGISQDLNRKDYILEYKKITDQYPKELHNPTIYDVFPDEELELLFRVVQAEVGDFDFNSKTNVASVIFNRYHAQKTTMTKVLTAKNQFETISNGRYLRITVDEDTILACEYVFLFGDTTSGSMFFDSTDGNSWASRNKEFVFRDDAGHDFYK